MAMVTDCGPYAQVVTPVDAQTAEVLRECAARWEARYPPVSPHLVASNKEGLLVAVSRARAAELREWADQIEGGAFWPEAGA